MKADTLEVRKLLSGQIQYIVPLFQRAYVWEVNKQVKQLFDDIKEIFEDGQDSRSEDLSDHDKSHSFKSHFLGSIVTLPIPHSVGSISKYQLIDGQQRLTTLIILLTALRDSIRAKNVHDLCEAHEVAAQIEEQYLINKYRKEKEHYRLIPTSLDMEALFFLVDEKKLESQYETSLLVKAYQYFFKKLKEYSLEELFLINNVCTEYLLIVNITLDEKDNPYVVFESLNGKGQPLAHTDLIKNYLFMQIADVQKQNELHETTWFFVQEHLGKHFNDFIKDHWMYQTGKRINDRDLYQFICSELNNSQKVESYLKALVTYAEYYKKFIDPKLEENNKISHYFHDFLMLNNSVIYPFLLGCYYLYDIEKKLTEEDFITILSRIESFLVRRYICNIQTRGLNGIFAGLLKKILERLPEDFESAAFLKTFTTLLIQKEYPSDSQFKEQFIRHPIYHKGQHYARFLLQMIERQKHANKEINILNNALTIEHVMPQTRNDAWEISETMHSEWVHTIGNLTLTGYNSELSNKAFSEKLKIYKESKLGLNQYFAGVQTWGIAEIQERAEHLLEIVEELLPDLKQHEHSTILKNVKGTKPHTVKIGNICYPASSWRKVLLTFAIVLFKLKPDASYWIRNFKSIFGDDPSQMRKPFEIENGMIYVETNHNADYILYCCKQLIQESQLIDKDDWEIQYD